MASHSRKEWPRGGNTWLCSSPAKLGSGEWRSRTAATAAGTPGLQRTDAAPQLVAAREDAGPLRVAARRADGEDRPRARRVLAAGQRRKDANGGPAAVSPHHVHYSCKDFILELLWVFFFNELVSFLYIFFCKTDIVTFLFVFDKYYLIIN